MNNKKKLKNLQTENAKLANSKIYANYSLCRNYRILWYNAKKLFNARKICGFWVSNGSVRIKEEVESEPLQIEHQSQLSELFPNFDFTAPLIPMEKKKVQVES